MSPDAPDRGERLLGLARVCAEAKSFHPAMFQRAIDWDGALVRATPAVEAAGDAQTYRGAIERLLAAIGDPETKVLEARAEGAPPSTWKAWASKDVLVLHARPPSDHDNIVKAERLVADAQSDLEHAKVVYDHASFVADTEPLIRAGFREREIARTTRRYGNMVHVDSTYETRRGLEGKDVSRGVNSIELYWDGTRWWISSVVWQSESATFPIPPELLSAPAPSS